MLSDYQPILILLIKRGLQLTDNDLSITAKPIMAFAFRRAPSEGLSPKDTL
jgi:hypothetical protein